MCGRFTLHHSTEEVAERFAVQHVLFPVTARYNIAPSQPIAVVTQDTESTQRRLEGYKWGLVPFWAKDPGIGNRMINARAETLEQKPAFKRLLMRRRCLIPADGFYEWRVSDKDKKEKTPLHIHTRDNGLFAFAGLWDEWSTPDGAPQKETLRTCTIITTRPNELIAPIHNRMAAMLRPEEEEAWLDSSLQDVPELMHLLRPYPAEEMEAYVVSRRVNTPAFDHADCIAPLVDEEGQLELLND